MKRNIPQQQTHTRGLPDATHIVHKDPTDYYGRNSTLYYYPEYATGLFSTGWEPYKDRKGEPLRFDTYQEAKDFLVQTCNDPEVKAILDHLKRPGSAVQLVRED